MFASMHQRAADWLVAAAWLALAVGVVAALTVLYDIFVRGYRQEMAIMEAVYPITALYFGPLLLWLYFRRGRRKSPKWRYEHPTADEKLGREVLGVPWWSTSKSDAHCGAGCTLGDICGEWIIWLTAWSIPIFGVATADTLMAMFVADFTLAWTFGIFFQYFTIVPMRSLGRLEGIWQAVKADTLSIVSFQVGLFGFMALYHLVLWKPPLSVDTPEYWFMMQIGMVAGYLTAWPVNAWLIHSGIKERM